jgi:HK97 family phage prohead protease
MRTASIERKDTGAFRGETGHAFDLDIKAFNDQGEFEGYASTFGNVDRGGDICVAGCFAESLQKRPASKVKMLLHHDTRRICGTWAELVEDSKGLLARGRLLLTTDDGKNTYELMRAGALDAMSIGYRTLVDEIDRQTGVRKIVKADLMEVSLVTFPMNERATVNTVKSARDFTTQDWRDIEAALRDEGLSRADAVKAVSGLKTWLQRDAGEPNTGPRDEAPSAATAALLALRRLEAAIRG